MKFVHFAPRRGRLSLTPHGVNRSVPAHPQLVSFRREYKVTLSGNPGIRPSQRKSGDGFSGSILSLRKPTPATYRKLKTAQMRSV